MNRSTEQLEVKRKPVGLQNYGLHEPPAEINR